MFSMVLNTCIKKKKKKKKIKIVKYVKLQIYKSKSKLCSLILKFLESFNKSNFLLKYYENPKKVPMQVSVHSKIIIGRDAVFFGFAVDVSMESLVKTPSVTVSTKIFLKKVYHGKQMQEK